MLTDEQRTNVVNWKHRLLYGGYEQTQGSLKDDTGYCCLGVAAEVLGYKLYEDVDNHAFYYTRADFSTVLTGILAYEDAESLGFNTRVEPDELELAVDKYLDYVPYSNITTRLFMLTKLNDDGCSFADIVEFVEKVGWDK